AAYELKNGPQADGHDGRDRYQETEQEDDHPVPREQDDVRPQHGGDGPRGAQVWDDRVGIHHDLGEAGDDPGDQVARQVQDRPDVVLDVVAKDEQEEHVAAQVQPAGVHEHAGQQGQVDRAGTWRLRDQVLHATDRYL